MTEHLAMLCALGVGLVLYATGRRHHACDVQSDCCYLALDLYHSTQTWLLLCLTPCNLCFYRIGFGERSKMMQCQVL